MQKLLKINILAMEKIEVKKNFIQQAAYTLLFITLLIYGLIEAKQFLYPIFLAVLLSYLLFPLVNFLEKKIKIPRALAILLGLIVAFVFLYGAISFMVSQIKNLASDIPALKRQAIDNLKAFQAYIDTHFGFSIEEQEKWMQAKISEMLENSGKILKSVAVSATLTIEAILFIPIFTFFMLLYRDRFKNFVLKLAETKNSKLTENLLEEISSVTIRYVIGVITVVIILAISHSVALTIIGVKYAIILGILAAMMSFIPYFGTLVSGIIPLTFSLITSSNPYEPLFIALYYWAITFVDHNILTPTIVGGNVNLNPFITILGIIIAGTIWGIPGMIIIVPTLGIIKIICDNVPGLEPYGYILGIEHKKWKISRKFKKLRELDDEQ